MNKHKNKHRKKTLLCRLAAAFCCFAIIAALIPATAAQAASDSSSGESFVTLKYKGKTLDISYSAPTYAQIEKAFGKPDSVKKEPYGLDENIIISTYKADGFRFTIRRHEFTLDDPEFGKHIVITSKKAAMNGLKVGMSYEKVQKQLIKLYGESNLQLQKNKKKIVSNSMNLPYFQYVFKDGKLSKIEYLNS